MALARFVVIQLCALMRESEQLASLLDGKTLIVYHSAIGKTHRRVLKVFHKPEKRLSLTQYVVSRAYYEDPGTMNQNWVISYEMVIPSMDFHGFFENELCSRVPSTPTTKNYAANEVSWPKSFSRKKNIFLQKMFFRNIFDIFRHLKISIFAFLSIRRCVRP